MLRLLAVAVLFAVAASSPQSATLIVVNARIFTGVPDMPWAEAMVAAGDRIVRVGTSGDVRPLGSASTRVIDAGGRLLIPGINDAHTHPGASPPRVALEGPSPMTADPSWHEILQRVKQALAGRRTSNRRNRCVPSSSRIPRTS